MNRILKITVLALSVFCFSGKVTLAQTPSGGVVGTVINRSDKAPVEAAHLSLYSGATLISEAVSAPDGTFSISELPDGMYTLTIKSPDFLETQVNVTVNDGFVKNMFKLSLTPTQKVADIDDSAFAEFDMDDSGYQDNPTILSGSNDVFNNVAGYNFSAVRFRNRGYSSESQVVNLMGVKMNDAITGYGPYSLWSGLNEATRSKETVNGAETSRYGVGGYNGVTDIDATAEGMRTGWRSSILTNSALYRLRLMTSYSSGVLDNGWSYGFNVSARLGDNDWIKGVYYRSFAYHASVGKKINDANSLSLVFMAAPGERGAQNASTQEVYDLVGDNMYNSNWGYQNGRVRNARVKKTHEPIAVLKYDYTPSDKFKAGATVLYRFGKNGYTALDWYDALDPRPDYYRNLPSYYYNADKDYGRVEGEKAFWIGEAWSNNVDNISHIDWDRLYTVNSLNLDKNGTSRSKYIQEERRTDQRDFNVALNASWRPEDRITIRGGLNARLNRTEYYKQVADLLGGEYYVDLDNFAERDYASTPEKVQNDLDYYNAHGAAQILHKGDKYGYDYYAHVHNASIWADGELTRGSLGLSAAMSLGYSKFWREGLVRKGLFPGLNPDGTEIYSASGEKLTSYDELTGKVITSLGNSEKSTFLTGTAKLGASYLINGKMKAYANVGLFRDAPYFNMAFLSPRTRNSLVPDLKSTRTFSADASWQYVGGGYNVRATLYYTTIKDQTDVMSFYDDLQNSFTNFAMSGIDQRHAGVELGFKVPTPVSSLFLQGALSWGSYIYTSNPHMTQTVDNSSEVTIDNEVVSFWKSHPVFKRDSDGNITTEIDYYQKHYVPSTPQFASSLGLSYNFNYWFIEADLEYFANSYLDMNPLYRTDMAVAGTDNDTKPEEVEYMCEQERFDPAFLVNFSVGKSWYIHNHQLGFSFQVRNLLNKLDVKTGGYEQTRLIDDSVSKGCYYRFDSKYFYMSGMNYMLNVYFKF